MASPTAPASRIAAVDGLRARAALSVLGLHVWYASGLPQLDTPVGPFATTLLAAGYVGVDFFFVLTGFVLFLPVCLNSTLIVLAALATVNGRVEDAPRKRRRRRSSNGAGGAEPRRTSGGEAGADGVVKPS